MYRRFMKRFFDITISGVSLIVLSPVLIVVSILVRTKLGKPVIFTQKRPGWKERIFTLYKFRSMTDEKDENGNLLPDEVRLTRFGQLLRKTSLDELPELWNIFRGDMSFVGPRPLLVQYLPLYNKKQKRRHDVRPGLTGLAQISGRNSITWEDRFDYDIAYVDKITLLIDIKIILGTILIVLKRSGINSETSATMEAFYGNDKKEDGT